MGTAKWIYCPICKNKTRTKIRTDTKLINFPLYCPKCKQENLINASKLKITVIKEPDSLQCRADNSEDFISHRLSAHFYYLSPYPV